MADHILYFTELLGLKVYDLRRRVLGRVRDAALVPLVHPVRIDRLLIGGGGWSWLTVRYDQIESISLDGIYLADENVTPYHADDYILRLARDLLDQQIIDSEGRKVVRVTDVTFEIKRDAGQDILTILEVDVGVRSVFRRLVQGVIPRRWIRVLQRRIPPNSISWSACNILEPDPQRRLRLNITPALLEKMHPADLADIVEELGPDDREAIFESMDPEAAAEALSEVEPDIQAQIIESLETERAADILEEMSPAEAADVLGELKEETSEEILEEMEEKKEVEELLEYGEETAGAMMNTEFVSLPETASAAQALAEIRKNEKLLDSLNTVFVTDGDGKLSGAAPLARIIFAEPDTPLKSLAAGELIRVRDTEKSTRVIALFDKYNILTLPVVDEEGRLAGVVTADDVIAVLRQA